MWLSTDIAGEAMEIIEASWRIGAPIRMLALTGRKLVPAEDAREQLSFFLGDGGRSARTRREKLEQTVDGIRARFGKDAIYPGSVIQNDLGIHERHGPADEEES
jgi:DNA polymerase-4